MPKMKTLLTLFCALCLFALGYLAGEYKGSLAACKGNNTFIARLLNKKSDATLHVYTKATCPYCSGAKDLLGAHAIDYAEIDISDNAHLKAEMIRKSKGRKTVPQIFVGDTHIGGFDDLQTIVETFKPCKADSISTEKNI